MRFGVFLNGRSWFAGTIGIAMVVCASALLLVTSAPCATLPTDTGKLSADVLNQIAALEQEKANRTPAEQKVDSHLLFARKMKLGLPIAKGIRTQRVLLDRDSAGLVLVDIGAEVTEGLLNFIKTHGKVVSAFPQYHAVRARIALGDIAGLTARNDVHFVGPAVRANHSRVDSEGDYTHQANLARQKFEVDGTGVKVGVLSDSVDYLANSQVAGRVTILPAQSGTPGTGEGTAMLEIVNDLAPGAKLYFATAFSSRESFADNILQLRAAGCDIIVDDVIYADESPFQDGLIAQAVDAVTADGALYFSSAGNFGNKNSATSATWEGDFFDGGPTSPNLEVGRLHNFGGATTYNTVLPGHSNPGLGLNLFWSDPLGHSVNDYDVFVLDPTGTHVVAASTISQTGTQDPYEHVDFVQPNERIVIVKFSGDGRFLHIDIGGGLLRFATPGRIRGHCCSVGALAVGAVNARRVYPNAFVPGDPIESFSSDGPRRVFFHSDGTPITSGNYSSLGGTVLQKPDIAAADGVITDFPPGNLNPFFGTSAAAPHAAAIAALVESFNPTLAPSQVKTILTDTALDIMGPGIDRDSGAGIVMALGALQAAQTAAASVLPNVQITQPQDGSILSGQVSVRVIAADASASLVGIALYRFSADAAGTSGYSLIGSNSLSRPIASTSFPWDTTSISNGNYALFAVAYDAAGNQGFSQIINSTVLNDTLPSGGPSFGNYSADPLWQAANDMIEQLELMLDVYLNGIALRNAEIISIANQQSVRFGRLVRPQLITPDQHWLDYISGQINSLQARQYQIQLKYLQKP